MMKRSFGQSAGKIWQTKSKINQKKEDMPEHFANQLDCIYLSSFSHLILPITILVSWKLKKLI
jgi:hypothetical protein